VRKIAGISVRRVNQIWKVYRETGAVPELGQHMGLPSKPLEIWELELVGDAYQKYRVGADTLERVIRGGFWDTHSS